MVALALTYTDAMQLNMAGPIKLGKVARTWLSKGEHICAPSPYSATKAAV